MFLGPLRIKYDGSQYVRAFDGFRGYGMSCVFLYHCLIYPPLKQWISWIWFGVDFFFVISGFLITGILLDTRKDERCLRNFYVRRVLRIFPLYYGTLAVFTAVLWMSDTVRSERMLANMPWFWTYTQNYLIALDGWSSMLPIAHFWSLAIEEQFYMLWPLLVVRFKNPRLLWICAVASVFSCTLRQFDVSWPYAYMFTFTRLEGLMLGAVIAMLIRTHRSLLERVVPYALPLSAVGLGVIAWTQRGFHLSNEWVIRAGYPLMAVFFGGILLVALDEGRAGKLMRWFTNRTWLVFIGNYSYGIYIFHWILHCQFKRPIYGFLDAHLESTFAVSMSYTLVMAALSLGLSIVSFHLFEKRCLRLKDAFAPRATA